MQGLHHITAVASDPQKNVDFFHNLLGQRLVKTTVNFDDPGTYHFYYADKIGTPGTVMTYFPWRHLPRGRRGNGETGAMAYSIRPNMVGFWVDRLKAHGVEVSEVGERFGTEVIGFADPDGLPIELITTEVPATLEFWENGPVPEEAMLLGFHSVTLWVDEAASTGKLLIDGMGYEFVGKEGNRHRYKGASNDIGLYIDLLEQPGVGPGRFGAGSVHHIAFRTVDDPEQLEYRQKFINMGFQVTPVRDRQYFHSIYFSSPGGTLFEVATDAPGFLYDEPVDVLGTNLKLPPWLESRRDEISQRLPKFEIKPVV